MSSWDSGLKYLQCQVRIEKYSSQGGWVDFFVDNFNDSVAKRLMLKPSSSLERFVRLLQGKRAQKWDLRLFRPRGSTAVRPLPSDSRVSSHACTERFQGSWTRSVRMR
eukprot:scaffold6433_cov125-Cylindrotheca_fusiformis.AAC.6